MFLQSLHILLRYAFLNEVWYDGKIFFIGKLIKILLSNIQVFFVLGVTSCQPWLVFSRLHTNRKMNHLLKYKTIRSIDQHIYKIINIYNIYCSYMYMYLDQIIFSYFLKNLLSILYFSRTSFLLYFYNSRL